MLYISRKGTEKMAISVAAKRKVIIPNNLFLALGSFPDIHSLLRMRSTLPITSAEDKNFHFLWIKTCTRYTLAEEHLSDHTVIAMH